MQIITDFKKHLIIISSLFLLTIAIWFIFGKMLKNESYDQLTYLIGGKIKKPHKDVVLLLIDENALKYGNEVGLSRWPWGRKVYKPILDFLRADGNPKGIFFDILFDGIDKSEKKCSDDELSSDEIFQEGVIDSGRVYQNMLLLSEEQKEKRSIDPVIIKYFSTKVKNPGDIGFSPFPANNYTVPIDCLMLEADCNYKDAITDLPAIAAGLAVASFEPDSDGIHRRGHILFNYDKNYFPSLSLAAIQAYQRNKDNKIPDVEIVNHNILKVGKYTIPVDDKGKYLINYYQNEEIDQQQLKVKKKIKLGAEAKKKVDTSLKAEAKKIRIPAINTISVGGLLYSKQMLDAGFPEKMIVKPSEFKDKIIIIGCSAVGCEDRKVSPVDPSMPGPEIHATLISNILQENHIISIESHLNLLFLLLYIAIFIFTLILTKKALLQFGTPLVMLLLAIAGSFFLFHEYNVLFPFMLYGTSGIAISVVAFGYRMIFEGKEKRKYSKVLGNMVDPQIVKEALTDLESLKKGSEKVITAFFSDIASFSSISEKLSAADLAALLNEYLSAMTLLLKEENGTLDKYIGDAIVGIFNAPIDTAGHPEKAARASLRMIAKLEEMKKVWVAENSYCVEAQNMQFRIGLNTGMAKVGFMGTDELASYTMMGDTVNLAARLEAAGKDYGVKILISEFTKKELSDAMFTRELDYVRVKGKDEPVRLFELVGLTDELPENIIASANLYEQGFKAYMDRDWPKAVKILTEAITVKKAEDKSAEILVKRCKYYIQKPPAKDWDGVFTRTHK